MDVYNTCLYTANDYICARILCFLTMTVYTYFFANMTHTYTIFMFLYTDEENELMQQRRNERFQGRDGGARVRSISKLVSSDTTSTFWDLSNPSAMTPSPSGPAQTPNSPKKVWNKGDSNSKVYSKGTSSFSTSTSSYSPKSGGEDWSSLLGGSGDLNLPNPLSPVTGSDSFAVDASLDSGNDDWLASILAGDGGGAGGLGGEAVSGSRKVSGKDILATTAVDDDDDYDRCGS